MKTTYPFPFPLPPIRCLVAGVILAFFPGCDGPDAESSAGSAAGPDPEAGPPRVETLAAELESLDRDLARMTAVGEALEREPERLAARFLEQGEFRGDLERHERTLERLFRRIEAMDPAEREPFRDRIQASVRSLEGRMEEAMATGPAAQDAFGPVMAGIRDRLRSGL
jgi:hypothetical protein